MSNGCCVLNIFVTLWCESIMLSPSMFSLIAGILPAIVLVFYIYLLDKNQREPFPWIAKAFCYGIAAVVPIMFAEAFLSVLGPPDGTFARAFYDAFLVAAMCEEGMKLLFLWLLLRRNPYFDERMDCIVYAVCVSMGFAAVENVGYLVRNLDNLTEIAISRAAMSVPGHFFFAVFMGYFMSLAIWGRPTLRRRNWFLTLFVPVVLHGIYDACLMSIPISEDVVALALAIFVALGVFVWVGGHRRISRVLLRDKGNMPHAMLNPFKQEGIYNKDEKSPATTIYPPVPEENPVADAVASSPEIHDFGHRASVDEGTREASTPTRSIFRHFFSFSGRIGRVEYALSFFVYFVWYSMISEGSNDSALSAIASLASIPVLWFFIAQSCKRCHDLNRSGFWMFVPFYFLWLMLQAGDPFPNEYGECPSSNT